MRNDDRDLTQLMNRVLDGEASPAESDRLRRALESRPDLKAEYEKLGRAVAAMDRLGMEEPPTSLKQDVMRAVRAKSAPQRGSAGWLGSLTLLLGGGSGIRYGASFAAGAAAAVLAVTLLTGNLTNRLGLDSRSMSGAMLPVRGDTYRVITKRQFNLQQGSVLAEALSGKTGIALRLTSDAPQGTEITVSYEAADWGARSMGQDPAGNEVMLGTGRLSVRMLRAGRSSYLLDLARRGPAESPLRIAIHSPDGFVQGELDTRALRSGS
jgi:hypothetical protein